MTVELSDQDVRCLLSALNVYSDYWVNKLDRVMRRRRMIDTVLCQGLLDAQELDVDIALGKSKVASIDDLKFRLAQSMRETETE